MEIEISKELDALFPPTPPYRGHWVAVQLELIVGSNENLTILIAAIGENGEFMVHKCLKRELLDVMFGAQVVNFEDLTFWCHDSLVEYISKHKTFAGWKPPFSGVTVSEPSPGAAHNISGLVNQGIRFSSVFATLIPGPDVGDKSKREPSPHPLKSKIQGYAALPDNWDGYGADPLNKDVIRRSLLFADMLIGIGAGDCFVVPVCDGSVQFEWDWEADGIKKFLEVNVMPNGTIEWLGGNQDDKVSQWHEGKCVPFKLASGQRPRNPFRVTKHIKRRLKQSLRQIKNGQVIPLEQALKKINLDCGLE